MTDQPSPSYHNADASDAAAVGMDFGYPEHLHVQGGDRLTLLPETQYIPPVLTYARDGCGFEASSPDADTVREMFENHECFPRPQFSPPAVQWHESFGRLGTNLVGWSVIGMVLYLLFTLAE